MASGDAQEQSAEEAADETAAVRVALRVRPMLPTDHADGATECVFTSPGDPMIFLGSERAFTFDHVFGTDATQETVYSQCRVSKILRGALDGLNGTVFAYGQTGSGKTHTMGTACVDPTTSAAWDAHADAGVLPRAMRELFDAVRAKLEDGSAARVRVSATFVEIHREEVRDLLAGPGRVADLSAPPRDAMESAHTAQAVGTDGADAGGCSEAAVAARAHAGTAAAARGPAPGAHPQGSAVAPAGAAVTIREDLSGSIALAGASSRDLHSASDALRCVRQGAVGRATGATAMNATSSRSHAIFSLLVETDLSPPDSSGSGKISASPADAVRAKLHFVDLAGSERAKRTKAEGDRLQEGIHINRGLLALGNVICALTSERKAGAHVHVPYRESKLTRLLQDSLGGNALTLMVACVSPTDADFEETLNTLKYAHRARQIKNRPVVNHDLDRASAEELRAQVRALHAQLASATATCAVAAPASLGTGSAAPGMAGAPLAAGGSEAGALARRCAALEAQASTLRSQLARAGAEVGRLRAKLLAIEPASASACGSSKGPRLEAAAVAGVVPASAGGGSGASRPPPGAIPGAAHTPDGTPLAPPEGNGGVRAGSAAMVPVRDGDGTVPQETGVAEDPELVEADMAFAERQRRMAEALDALSESLVAKEKLAARFGALQRARAGGGVSEADADSSGRQGGEAPDAPDAAAEGAADAAERAEVQRLSDAVAALLGEREQLMAALAASAGTCPANTRPLSSPVEAGGGGGVGATVGARSAAEPGDTATETRSQPHPRAHAADQSAAHARLRALEASLDEARRKLRAAEALLRARASSDARLRRLQAEIGDMRAQKVALMRQMRAAAAEHAAARRQRERQLRQAQRGEQRLQAQVSKLSGLSGRQAQVLRKREEDLVRAHKQIRDQEARLSAAATRERTGERIRPLTKPPLPSRSDRSAAAAARTSDGLSVDAGSGAEGPTGLGAGEDGAKWLASAVDSAVRLQRLRAQAEAHVCARRVAKRDLDALQNENPKDSSPTNDSAPGVDAAAGLGPHIASDAHEELEGEGQGTAAARREALECEIHFRTDALAALQPQICALERDRTAAETRLQSAPGHVGRTLTASFGMFVEWRLAGAEADSRAADAQASLRDAVVLTEALGAQLDDARRDHARAQAEAEAAHQDELAALLRAREAGVARTVDALDVGEDTKGTAELVPTAAAQAVASAEVERDAAIARASAAGSEVEALRAQVSELEAKLKVGVDAGSVSMASGTEGGAIESEEGSEGREAPDASHRTNAAGRRRVVVSDTDFEDDDDSPGEPGADGSRRHAEAKKAGVGAGGERRWAARAAGESEEDTEEEDVEDDDDEEDEGSDVDWIETEEARTVIPKRQRAPRTVAGTEVDTVPQHEVTETEEPVSGESAGTAITTRRRALVEATARGAGTPVHTVRVQPAGLQEQSGAVDLPPAPPPPKRAPLGNLTNRSGNGSAPALPADPAVKGGKLPATAVPAAALEAVMVPGPTMRGAKAGHRARAAGSNGRDGETLPDRCVDAVAAKDAAPTPLPVVPVMPHVTRRKPLYVDRRARTDMLA